VAILANGSLAAAGSVSDLTDVATRGWELVVTGLGDEVLNRVRGRLNSATRLGDGRYALILAPATAPEPVVADLCASGVRVVSLNPLRGTLEDVFVNQVANASREPAARSKAS
jgi:hypothetical protein